MKKPGNTTKKQYKLLNSTIRIDNNKLKYYYKDFLGTVWFATLPWSSLDPCPYLYLLI